MGKHIEADVRVGVRARDAYCEVQSSAHAARKGLRTAGEAN